MYQVSKVSELFEKISHPTRVKILRLMEASPLNFSQLKNKLGIKSSGNLDHHIKKLEGLIYLDSDGLYKITDEGKTVLIVIRSIEYSFAFKETRPAPQSRQVFRVLLAFLGIFTLAITITVLATIPNGMTFPSTMGILFGLIGAIIGMLGAAIGLKRTTIADGKSKHPLTYFPSQKAPWTVGDWTTNLLFFGSYLTLLFSIIYVQISFANFPFKPLWYITSNFALIIMFIASLMTYYRIIEKANNTIQRLMTEH